jgi:PadR family transcriptional regulator PadR
VRLCRLGPSPVSALTPAYGWCMVAAALPRPRRLSPSRSVRFTNRFTEPVLDLRVSGPLDARAVMLYPSPIAQCPPPHRPTTGSGGELLVRAGGRRDAGGLVGCGGLGGLAGRRLGEVRYSGCLHVDDLPIVGRMAEPPMREPTYFVLAALLRGPLHGYAIMKRAEELSGGRVRLATGTLYTALDRLTAEGHVELVSEERVGGRVRRTYGLTQSGSAALRAEAVRMAEAARLVIESGAGKRAGIAARKLRMT